MAWTTPKTDWLESDRCTYNDMNRIAGNVNEICGTSLKADYTQDDVVALSAIQAIIAALEATAETAGYIPEDTLTEATTADGLNALESYTLGLCDWLNILERQQSAYIYLGDGVYLGEGKYLR